MATMRNRVYATPPAVALRKNFAANIKRARLDAHLTQRQLGKLANVSRDSIGQMESGGRKCIY